MMSIVSQVFMQGGVLMYPLLLIVCVLIGIIVRAMWNFFIQGGTDTAVIQNCLDGLLFWGGFAVLIGVLGSAVGYHKAMSTIAAFGVVNPRAVWIGTAEGMVPTITGLLVLAGAGSFWYLLRWNFLRNRHPSA